MYIDKLENSDEYRLIAEGQQHTSLQGLDGGVGTVGIFKLDADGVC